jgi:hypothetical protein
MNPFSFFRKRFFLCCRHFAMNQYKNIESRSLNLTAIPNLNLNTLDEIHLSKAWQTENNAEIIDELQDTISACPSPPKPKVAAIRILNSGVSVKDSPMKKIVRVVKRSAPIAKDQTKPEILDNLRGTEIISEPAVKKLKVFDETSINLPTEIPVKTVSKLEPVSLEIHPKVQEKPGKTSKELTKPKTPEKHPQTPKKSPLKKKETSKTQKASISPPEKKTEGIAEESNPPANKLLALIEVTPDQYEKLSKSLTAAERSEQITSLMTFIDNDGDIDPHKADNGNYFLIIVFMRSTIINSSSFTFFLSTR